MMRLYLNKDRVWPFPVRYWAFSTHEWAFSTHDWAFILAAKKQADPTLMTKEKFFAMLDRSEEDYRQGRCHEMLPDEDLTAFLKRVGYEV